MSDATFRLSDGRTLGYAEQGDSDGAPILLFHGIPGSRLIRHPDGEIARRLGVRLFTFDRPGIGLSSPQPGRRMLDWPRDVAEFADAQGLDRFTVMGWSGGGPYALATAHELPDRVAHVVLVASVTPLAGTEFTRELSPDLRRRARVGSLLPWFVHAVVVRDARVFARNPVRAIEREFEKGPECDRRILDDPSLKQNWIDSRHETYRQGTRGIYAEALLYLRPWGFDPANVRAPITVWHGESDETLSPAMGRHFADALAGSDATFVPGEGHMVCLTRWEEILRKARDRAAPGPIGHL
jgi:pimeloyl-ACP methyl ester carboxylesterase